LRLQLPSTTYATVLLSPTGGNRNHASRSEQSSSPLRRKHLHPAEELADQVRLSPLYAKPGSNGVLTALRIPLNDDMGEKAARNQARQALQDRQMNQIKAAVKTPMPTRRFRDGSESPDTTPRRSGHRGRESDVNGRAVTPMKRVPILANFEEWMKMATDNKINANNSWNFALIDYFHDMSLLREGDSVNFQKASCTLDGCVKIYTSRVDSVATETGKLLSGLADSRDKRGREADAEGDEDEDEDGEEGGARKSRKKVCNTMES
jgi:condensin complex subunit 2